MDEPKRFTRNGVTFTVINGRSIGKAEAASAELDHVRRKDGSWQSDGRVTSDADIFAHAYRSEIEAVRRAQQPSQPHRRLTKDAESRVRAGIHALFLMGQASEAGVAGYLVGLLESAPPEWFEGNDG